MHADQAWAARTPFTAPRLRTAAPLPLPLVAITDTNSARTAQLCSLSLRLPCSARARVISTLSSAYVAGYSHPSVPRNSALHFLTVFCFSQISRRWSCFPTCFKSAVYVSTHFYNAKTVS